MWTAILSFLGGPLINGAIGAYKAKLEAGNTQDRMAVELAERELAVQQREIEVQGAVLVAEQGNWFTRCVRPLWALPFVIYTWKLVIYDKVLAYWTNGSTDPLSGGMEHLILTVAACYFGGRTIEKVSQVFVNRKR